VFLTVLSNYVVVLNFVVFLRLLDRKFNKDFKNVLKTVNFLLQVGLTSNFVSDCQTVTAEKLQKSGFRKVFLQYYIENVSTNKIYF